MMTPDIEPILAEHPAVGREHLIPLLQAVQERCGYLSREAVMSISRHLGLPPSKVYGVATFYNQFRFAAPGRYPIQVCRGTACHVKGSVHVLDAVQRALGVAPGQTTRDGVFSLEVVACIGACGLAPAMVVGGEVYARVTPQKALDILDGYRGRAQGHDDDA